MIIADVEDTICIMGLQLLLLKPSCINNKEKSPSLTAFYEQGSLGGVQHPTDKQFYRNTR